MKLRYNKYFLINMDVKVKVNFMKIYYSILLPLHTSFSTFLEGTFKNKCYAL